VVVLVRGVVHQQQETKMRLFNRVDAAKQLGVHPATFDNFQKRFPSELEAYLIGGSMPRWSQEQLDKSSRVTAEDGQPEAENMTNRPGGRSQRRQEGVQPSIGERLGSILEALQAIRDEVEAGPQDQLLKFEQAARLLACDQSHVSRLVRTKRLPYVQTGDGNRGKRILLGDVDDFIRRNRTTERT
jgi:excisionase family DNA binding protein